MVYNYIDVKVENDYKDLLQNCKCFTVKVNLQSTNKIAIITAL